MLKEGGGTSSGPEETKRFLHLSEKGLAPHALGAGSQTRGQRWRRTNYNSQQPARRAAPTPRRHTRRSCFPRLRDVERSVEDPGLPTWSDRGPEGHVGRTRSERSRTL
ncbi:hypothetical protein J1605_001055 [Eschrichtius robustus]|uniref:Uncharacterized protein n=1 Tax=Eschrichtius robustus TaxID=9764 RepID=A0AB34GPV8_ESCRO|nr:hypothetical protein J1605_001055 [Eschrichtius robustus]